MMAGHIVVVLTFLWMQPRVLAATMGGVKATERIQQVVKDAVPALEDQQVLTPQTAHVSQSDESLGEENVEDVQEDDATPQSIGEGVSWSEPEVLASDVSWDDDEIELLD